jgi:multidrug efflux pump subunit AcrA (membrane-fusion protein)
MAHRIERLSAWLVQRRWLAVAALVVILGVCFAIGAVMHRRAAGAAAAAEQSIIVTPRPFSTSISVVGTVVAGDRDEMVAPFDGVIRQIGFDYGRPVRPGQILLAMDTFDLEQHLRDAKTAYLKAVQAEADEASWTTGPDVSRARRAVTSAEVEVRNTQRKAQESKDLLDKGWVARSEYEGFIQQEQTETTALAAAREDLATILKKGSGPSREVTEIDLQNARARLADYEAQFQGAIVKAPSVGVMVRPPAERMARPVCKWFVSAGLSSLHKRIRPFRLGGWPRWRSARPGPHKGAGVERHFAPKVVRTPIDCQAIFFSPPTDI